MTAAARVDTGRRAMLAKVHLAKKELGLADDVYRPLLERVTGFTSSSACTDAQLGRVLDEFKRLGWTPRQAGANPKKDRAPHPTSRAADHPSAKKARALWISLHQLGVVRDPSERALEAFAARQLGVERLQWADQGLTYKLIEALKAMAERGGWAQCDSLQELKARLVEAQWRVLVGLGVVPDLQGDEMLEWLRRRRIVPEVAELTGVPAAHLDEVIQSMGVQIWKAKRQLGQA